MKFTLFNKIQNLECVILVQIWKILYKFDIFFFFTLVNFDIHRNIFYHINSFHSIQLELLINFVIDICYNITFEDWFWSRNSIGQMKFTFRNEFWFEERRKLFERHCNANEIGVDWTYSTIAFQIYFIAQCTYWFQFWSEEFLQFETFKYNKYECDDVKVKLKIRCDENGKRILNVILSQYQYIHTKTKSHEFVWRF